MSGIGPGEKLARYLASLVKSGHSVTLPGGPFECLAILPGGQFDVSLLLDGVETRLRYDGRYWHKVEEAAQR